MPIPNTFPTLYVEALQIDISKLKRWSYLSTGQILRNENGLNLELLNNHREKIDYFD